MNVKVLFPDYHKCREDQFTCTSGHCVAIELKCDGNRDCQDMSDEQGCDPRYPGGRYCPIRKFECDNHVSDQNVKMHTAKCEKSF